MFLNDKQIKKLVEEHNMISPFQDRQVGSTKLTKRVSWGLGSSGYDIRIARGIQPFEQKDTPVLDPLGKMQPITKLPDFSDAIVLEPGQGALGTSMEYFRMPRNVGAICLGKSTYARLFLHVLMTPLEPGWEGNLTLEITNVGHIPVRVYAEQGISQLLFYEIEQPEISYADRRGKYQGQKGITHSKP
jgi:dCTP deaminase